MSYWNLKMAKLSNAMLKLNISKLKIWDLFGVFVMLQKGNKQNCYLNRTWASHIKKFGKRLTSKMRRRHGRNIIKEQLDYKFRERGR